MAEDSNGATLSAYENGIEQYNAVAIMTVSGSVQAWIDTSLRMLEPGAHILEIGSAHGRDALYMESKDFKVHRTDATRAFVKYIQKQGYEARLLNALTDNLGGPYDMVFANAVFLHFTEEQFKVALKKAYEALKSNGLLSFSVKVGKGSEWSNTKLKDARFYVYWQEQPLRETLEFSNFSVKYFSEGKSGRRSDNRRWLHVIACKH